MYVVLLGLATDLRARDGGRGVSSILGYMTIFFTTYDRSTADGRRTIAAKRAHCTLVRRC